MRHINGVYTQRYNRLKKTDGPLFRGRYKAILIEEDAYLLQLSRYIHRNPIETKQPLVKQLHHYSWSSYPAYVNKVKAPEWLHQDTLYGMLGQRQKYQGYQTYVGHGTDEEIEKFYSKTNIASVLGGQEFVVWLKEDIIPELDDRKFIKTVLSHSLTIAQIIKIVADFYKIEVKEITLVNKGPNKGLLARKVAMYICQQLGGYQLNDIMLQFGLSNIGSVSYITSQIRQNSKLDGKLAKQIEKIKLCIMKQVT